MRKGFTALQRRGAFHFLILDPIFIFFENPPFSSPRHQATSTSLKSAHCKRSISFNLAFNCKRANRAPAAAAATPFLEFFLTWAKRGGNWMHSSCCWWCCCWELRGALPSPAVISATLRSAVDSICSEIVQRKRNRFGLINLWVVAEVILWKFTKKKKI